MRWLPWSAPEVLVDSDEAEFGYRSGSVRVVVRHSFAAGWGVRVALTNLVDEPLEVDDAGLSWVADPDAPAWALAAGASGAYAVPSPDGTGPVLGGLLALGAFGWVTPEALGFGRLTVPPRGRFVVQWTWDWYRPGQGFARNQHLEVPWSLFLAVDQPVSIVADEDTALVLPRGGRRGAGTRADRALLLGGRRVHRRVGVGPGSRPGTTCTRPGRTTRSSPPRRSDALNGPTSPAGIVRLADVHAALAVQQALLAGWVDDPDPAEDALDLFLARTLDQPVRRPVPDQLRLRRIRSDRWRRTARRARRAGYGTSRRRSRVWGWPSARPACCGCSAASRCSR